MKYNDKDNNRNYAFSIAKAIGIILMVIGHSGCPLQLHNYIYMFHMPLFFFCSGYFFKPTTSIDKIKIFTLKKIKGLYIPYIKWGLLFLLFHNIFYHINIYNDLYGFKGKVSHLYTSCDFIKNFLNTTLTMRTTEQLLGGFWFIRILFLSSIILCLSFFFIHKFKLNKNTFAIILLCILIVSKIFNFSIPIIGNISLILYGILFMYAGYLYKQIEQPKFYRFRLFLLLTICVSIGSYTNYANMLNYEYSDIISYTGFAVFGIISVICISKILEKSKIAGILIYIGDNTIVILSLHFLSFKLISLTKILLFNLPIERLADFPVILEHNQFFWVIYSIIGIYMPILLVKLYDKYYKIKTFK